jgi:DNA-binding MarR family transcriptional regulator
MKAAKILARLGAARDAIAELRRAGQALGDELPRRRLDELRVLRAGLAGMKYPEASFELGYACALQDVMAAYEAAAQRLVDEEDAQAFILNEGWRDVLLALQSGSKRPADLAKETGKDPAWISRALQKLREAALVEASGGADGRTKPHRLTLLGARVLARLPAPVSGDLLRGIRVAVHLDSSLVSRGRLSVAELVSEAESLLGDQQEASSSVDEWLGRATSHGIAVCDSPVTGEPKELGANTARRTTPAEAAVLWRDSNYTHARRLMSLLYGIIRRDSTSVPSWIERLRAMIETGTQVFIRTKHAEVANAWRLLLLETLDSSRAAGHSRTITDADLLSGSFRALDVGAAKPVVIYDEPAIINTDPDTHPIMRQLMDKATEKWCVAADRSGVPAGFQHMPLHESQP